MIVYILDRHLIINCYLKFADISHMEYFVFVPYLEVIPEWKEYYYDYEAMNQVLDFVVECKSVYRKINKNIYPTHQTSKQTYPIKTKSYIPSAF